MLVKVMVSQPVAVPGVTTRTVTLKVGINEIDDSLFEHWFVKSLLNKGVISVPDKKKKINFKSLEQIAEEKRNEKQVETIIMRSPEVPLSMREPEVEVAKVEVVEVNKLARRKRKE